MRAAGRYVKDGFYTPRTSTCLFLQKSCTLIFSLLQPFRQSNESEPRPYILSTTNVTIRFADQPRFRILLSPFAKAKASSARFIHFLIVVGTFLFSASHVFGQDVQVPTDGSGDGGGAQIGRWRLPVRITVSANGGYDDNPNGDPSGSHGSLFTGASIG